ncbi:MAG: hypothetical protein H8E18_13330 [FCB group bacterium]|nr:hypothetical protein [FCB group bacterium]
MDIQTETLLHDFKTLKNHCSILDPAIIKEYFPDGDFEPALNKFFDVEVRDVESFYALDYPFQGQIVFSESKFVELVEVIPEFIVSLIKVGMPFIVSLHRYQRSRISEPVLLSLPNLVESSKVVYHSWNLLGDLLQQESDERQSSITELETKLGQLVRTKPHYDLLGTLQNVYNSIVLMSISEDILEQGFFDLFIHPDKEKREALYSLAGRELSALRTLSNITNDESIEEIIPRIRQDLLKNGYPQLNQPGQTTFILEAIKNTDMEVHPEYVFRLKGEYWEIGFDGNTIRLKDSKGLQYINALLKNPNQAIRSDSLTAPHVNVSPGSREDISVQVTEKRPPVYNYAPDKTYTAMTNKIKELEQILEELVPGSDEYFLAEDHLKKQRKERSRYFDRSGQERPQDSGEKARQSVSTAISNAKKKINKDLPELIVHLTNYLHTGFECIYDPPPDNLKSWHF